MVERLVANEKVEGSTPFARSKKIMKICIEGWRKINHSYALVNQRQLIELTKYPVLLKHRDVSFYNKNWNEKKNFNGFSIEDNLIIDSIEFPKEDEIFDVIYRISFPYNFKKSLSKKLFVFGTSEYQNIKDHYNQSEFNDKKLISDQRIITTSNWSKQGFLKAGFTSSNIQVLSCGVDKKSFYIIDQQKKDLIKKKLNIRKDNFVISSVGAMSENKGIDYLLIAYLILKKKYNNLILILKDQSNLYNINVSEYLNKIKKTKYSHLLNENSLKDIIIISKNLSIQMLNDLYNISDCYVSSYRAEGFNMTPLEALSSGTPIIVTKGGSTDDYFSEEIGLQIESNLIELKDKTMLDPNLDSLIANIAMMIDKKKVYNSIDLSNYAQNNYNWSKITAKLIDIFKK